MKTPTPKEIRDARTAAGMTQTQAAATIHCSLGAWQKWEDGQREMHCAFFELFQLKACGFVPT